MNAVWSDLAPDPCVLVAPVVRNVTALPAGHVGLYIGRAMASRKLAESDWCNTHKLDRDTPEGRERAVHGWAIYTLDHPRRQFIGDLAGKDLLCWCAPKLCHGDALVAFVALTLFHKQPCPHCGRPVASFLNWHAGLQVLTEAWTCEAPHSGATKLTGCGRRGDRRRKPPGFLTPPRLLC